MHIGQLMKRASGLCVGCFGNVCRIHLCRRLHLLPHNVNESKSAPFSKESLPIHVLETDGTGD